MDETNDVIRQIAATFEKDKEDSNIHKIKGETAIDKIEYTRRSNLRYNIERRPRKMKQYMRSISNGKWK